MPRTSAIPNLPLTGWGRLDLASPAPARPRRRDRGKGAGELVAAVLLVVAWAMLWAFFVVGVVEPGADLGARAAAHPSLQTPALPDARSGAEPGPVDTTGRAP
jgi:hypothetical protein